MFNDGIPSLTPVIHGDIIRGISDEAIDECYPPATAEEAAELEAAEHFCAIMARLEAMEEREERARKDFTGWAKRWHARRMLQGKPKPSRASVQRRHRSNSSASNEDQVTLYDRRYQVAASVSALEVKRSHEKISNRQEKRSRQTFKPIQQPRKSY